MKKEALQKTILDSLKIDTLHPLHYAILDEACEVALSQERTPEELLKVALYSFNNSIELLHATINTTFAATNANTITFNYREQSFLIKREEFRSM